MTVYHFPVIFQIGFSPQPPHITRSTTGTTHTDPRTHPHPAVRIHFKKYGKIPHLDDINQVTKKTLNFKVVLITLRFEVDTITLILLWFFL